MHGDVDRMISMAGDLLDLSRLESGQAPLHLYPLDVRPLMEDVKSRFEDRARDKGVQLSVAPTATCRWRWVTRRSSARSWSIWSTTP